MDDIVEVQYLHNHHGLAGKVSNHSKSDVMSECFDFVDANSQPNGRRAGSYSAQFFLPKFTLVATPRVGEKNFDKKSKSSVVAEFNTECRERRVDKPVAPLLRFEWLKKHRPNVALHPSMTDYCDTCKYLKEQLSRNQAILNRYQRSESTPGA